MRISMGRPRKKGKRKPCGRLAQVNKDPRLETALTRVRDFGVTPSQATNPLSGYLAGVLFLRGRITSDQIGKFYSFLEMSPSALKGARIIERIQGMHVAYRAFPVNRRYHELISVLGKRIEYLHALANDRLVCPVKSLKHTLDDVPLTRGGYQFKLACELHRPEPRRRINLTRKK